MQTNKRSNCNFFYLFFFFYSYLNFSKLEIVKPIVRKRRENNEIDLEDVTFFLFYFIFIY